MTWVRIEQEMRKECAKNAQFYQANRLIIIRLFG